MQIAPETGGRPPQPLPAADTPPKSPGRTPPAPNQWSDFPSRPNGTRLATIQEGPQNGLPARRRRPHSPHGVTSVTEQDIEAKVIDIVAEQLGADKAKITRETSFVDDLNADSLDTVELVMEFEDAFETSIPDDKAEQIKTVGQAIEFIKGAQGVDG